MQILTCGCDLFNYTAIKLVTYISLFVCAWIGHVHSVYVTNIKKGLITGNSGGCNPINCLSQTTRNLTIEFLDLNFASRRKLCENSVFSENMNTAAFILFGIVFVFLHFCSFPFRKCIPLSSLSEIDIFRDNVPDLKISIRSVTVDTFNWIASRWYIRQIYCRKYKEIYTSQINQVLDRCFLVFSVRIGRGYQTSDFQRFYSKE